MAIATKSKGSRNRAHTGRPTGPRSSEGKRRSSQNSAKHLIFSGRVLEDEKKDVVFLTRAWREQLRPRGPAEDEAIEDIVINRLRNKRIDKYEARAFKNASLYVVKHRCEKSEKRETQAWLRTACSGDEALGSRRDRLPPNHCISFLMTFKGMIEKRGPRPDEDSKLLRFIYGGQFTELGATMMSHFSELECARKLEKDEKKLKILDQEYSGRLREIVEDEIEYQIKQARLEATWENVEFPLGVVMFPEDSIVDRIERYRTSNAREFSRLLENFEIIRRLSDQA